MIVHDSFSVSCFPRKSAGSFKMSAKSCSRVSRGSSENSVDIEDDNPDIIEKVHVIDETLEELEEPPSKKNRITKRSSARWSNDLIFRLIDEYEARPCLWDIFSKDYHNRDITGKVKQEMEEIFSLQWREISNQLTKLRQILSQNQKKIQAVKSGQSTDELFKPTWIFWKPLQFLLPVLNPRSSRDTLPDESPEKSSINDIADEEASSTSISPGVKLRKTKSGKCDRKAQSAITEVKNELMMECLKVMKTPESSATAGPSAEASFASYITEKLKLLDNRRRMIAEKRISDIIWELQMDMEQSMTSGSDLSLTLSQPHYPVASSFYQWSS